MLRSAARNHLSDSCHGCFCSCPQGRGRHEVLKGYLTPRVTERRQPVRLNRGRRNDAAIIARNSSARRYITRLVKRGRVTCLCVPCPTSDYGPNYSPQCRHLANSAANSRHVTRRAPASDVRITGRSPLAV